MRSPKHIDAHYTSVKVDMNYIYKHSRSFQWTEQWKENINKQESCCIFFFCGRVRQKWHMKEIIFSHCRVIPTTSGMAVGNDVGCRRKWEEAVFFNF